MRVLTLRQKIVSGGEDPPRSFGPRALGGSWPSAGSVCAAFLSLLTLFGSSPSASASMPPDFEPEIVNGLPTSDWPSVASVFTGSGFCSGTFIGCHTVLTAAHCVCNASGTGAACPDGTFLLDPANFEVYAQHAGFFYVANIAVAPGYHFAVRGDVAVLDLEYPVRSIRPSPINTLQRPPFGTSGTIVGFGKSSASSPDEGMKRYGAVTTGPCSGSISNATHVCWSFSAPIGLPGSDSNICMGDSGGPLFANLGAGTAVIGVTSGTVNSCAVGDIAFDADPYVERSFIQAQGGADLGNTACGDGAQLGDPTVTVWNRYGLLSGQTILEFAVPGGTKQLRVALNGERGSAPNDFDLYVRFGSPPSTSVFDCASAYSGNFEYCEFSDPAPGTWYVLLDTNLGGPGNYQVTATLLPENPAPVPPLETGDVVVADFAAWEIMHAELTSGDRAITSSPLRGSGPDLAWPEGVALGTNGAILVTNMSNRALLAVDPASGARTLLSGCSDADCSSVVGTGSAFFGPRLAERDTDGQILVTDRSNPPISSVVRVDPTTGNRVILSGCADASCSSLIGSGPPFEKIYGIGLETGGNIIVADTVAVFRIDPLSGARTIVSGCTNPSCTTQVGSGPSFGDPIDVEIELDGHILVTDSAEGSPFRAVFRVDPLTGARSVLSGCANAACTGQVGTGTLFSDGLWGIARAPGGELLVTDYGLQAIFRVNPLSGNRTLVSGCVDASCASLTGAGTQFTQPLGIVVLPEPSQWLSLATGIAFLAIAQRWRTRRRGRAARAGSDNPKGMARVREVRREVAFARSEGILGVHSATGAEQPTLPQTRWGQTWRGVMLRRISCALLLRGLGTADARFAPGWQPGASLGGFPGWRGTSGGVRHASSNTPSDDRVGCRGAPGPAGVPGSRLPRRAAQQRGGRRDA